MRKLKSVKCEIYLGMKWSKARASLLCLYKWEFYKRTVTEFSFLRYDNDSSKK